MMRNWLMAFAVASVWGAGMQARAQVGVSQPVAAVPATSAEIENLKLQIELLKKTREVLHAQEQARALQDEVRAAQEKAGEAAAREASLADKVEAMQDEKAKLEAAAAQDAEKLAAAQTQLQARVAELQKTRRELSDQKDAVARLESELSIEKNVSEMSVKRANALQKALGEARDAQAREAAGRKSAAAELAKSRTDHEKTLGELDAQRKARADAEAQVRGLQGALQDREKAAADRLDRETQARLAAEKQLADARAEREAAVRDLDAARKSIGEQEAGARDREAAFKEQMDAIAARLEQATRAKEGAEAEIARHKDRLAELDPKVAEAKAAAERQTKQDIVSRHCAEAFEHAQKQAWLPCLLSWKAAVDEGYRPDGYGYARSCMKQALESGLAEIPAGDQSSQGLEKLSLADRNEKLRAVYAEILAKIGPDDANP